MAGAWKRLWAVGAVLLIWGLGAGAGWGQSGREEGLPGVQQEAQSIILSNRDLQVRIALRSSGRSARGEAYLSLLSQKRVPRRESLRLRLGGIG